MSGVTRPLSQMRKVESKEQLFRARKRILKYLVQGYLRQEGWWRTAEVMTEEAGVTADYELCDNIDLDIILQDYISYYLIRFSKQPQFCRKVEERPATSLRRPQTRRQRPQAQATPPSEACEKSDRELLPTFTVTQLFKEQEIEVATNFISSLDSKPLSGFLSGMAGELRQLAELVYQDIIRPSTVTWDDVKGLTAAKSLLMESVIYPVRYPEVFTGMLEPWRGVLLHGPPGTGKTMIARAVASESQCTFFNVSCSTVINKWRGDSEKIVKILFEMASYYSPSIVFIDEVETLASERSCPGEHEASRRLKSQLLIELDGFNTRDGIVFLLANSNMPWEVDPAMLRRLEKRIHIPLPDVQTRTELFEKFLTSKTIEILPKADFTELAAKTEGYSGSDIKLACKEALMTTVRKMLPTLAIKGYRNNNTKDILQFSDILTAVEKTKPVSKKLAKRHEDWQTELGCS